jgi:hypothetical protein
MLMYYMYVKLDSRVILTFKELCVYTHTHPLVYQPPPYVYFLKINLNPVRMATSFFLQVRSHILPFSFVRQVQL